MKKAPPATGAELLAQLPKLPDPRELYTSFVKLREFQRQLGELKTDEAKPYSMAQEFNNALLCVHFSPTATAQLTPTANGWQALCVEGVDDYARIVLAISPEDERWVLYTWLGEAYVAEKVLQAFWEKMTKAVNKRQRILFPTDRSGQPIFGPRIPLKAEFDGAYLLRGRIYNAEGVCMYTLRPNSDEVGACGWTKAVTYPKRWSSTATKLSDLFD